MLCKKILIALALLSISSFAIANYEGSFFSSEKLEKKISRMEHVLDLNHDQKTNIKEIFDASTMEIKENFNELVIIKKKMMNLNPNNIDYDSEIKSLSLVLGKHISEQAVIHGSLRKLIFNELTEDQRELINKRFDKRDQRSIKRKLRKKDSNLNKNRDRKFWRLFMRGFKEGSLLKTAITMAVFLYHFALIIKILSILSICHDFKKIYNQFY